MGAIERVTDERRSRAALVQETPIATETGTRIVQRISDSPLDMLHARGKLGPDGNALWEAGDRYRTDWAIGKRGMWPEQWHERVGHGVRSRLPQSLATEAVVAARQRLREARDRLPGPIRSIVDDVLLHELPLEAVARGWLPAAASTTARVIVADRLRIGLRILAEHYGIG